MSPVMEVRAILASTIGYDFPTLKKARGYPMSIVPFLTTSARGQQNLKQHICVPMPQPVTIGSFIPTLSFASLDLRAAGALGLGPSARP